MRWLSFAPALEDRTVTAGAKRLRQVRFEARSSLPTAAACVVANGVRETLSSLLGAAVALRLLAPSIPTPQAWPIVLNEALLYRLRGHVADAAIVLRTPDALALAAALFGESRVAALDRALSPMERDLLDRAINALAGNLAVVCGTPEGRFVERVAEIRGFVTYFEVSIEEPVAVRIGIALSRDPSPEARGSFEFGHLAAAKLKAVASLDLGKAEAAEVARLAPGAIVPIDPSELRRCALSVAGRSVARGTCGIRNGRFAFSVDAMREV
ncbi:MAG: FliM/FliN family flagellar motor switch protein [Candidatus Cybelea sp.]